MSESQSKPAPAPRIVPRSVQATMLVAVVVGLMFTRPYFATILFAALVAFIFNPVYKAVLRRTRRQGLALTTTLITAVLSLIIPLVLITGITVAQTSSLISNFKSDHGNLGPAQLESIVERGADRVNGMLGALPGGQKIEVDKNSLQADFKEAGTQILQGFVSFIKSAGGAALSFISIAILAFFMIVAMLRYQGELVNFMRDASPLEDHMMDKYLHQAGAMTKAMVKGQLVIALFQGVSSALSLWVVGIDYFWFFAVVLTFLSFIPLGGGILTIPIGIILMLTGHVPQGLFVILFHLIVVTNIDNFLRPRLVPKSAQLNPALTLLSVFSGLAMFGPPGVIYGPVLMILLITTYQMYADYNKTAKARTRSS